MRDEDRVSISTTHSQNDTLTSSRRDSSSEIKEKRENDERKNTNNYPSDEQKREMNSDIKRNQQHEEDIEAIGSLPMPQEALSTGAELQDQYFASKDCSKASSQHDSNVIGWDGPNDPTNPKNFSDRKKWITTLLFG